MIDKNFIFNRKLLLVVLYLFCIIYIKRYFYNLIKIIDFRV